MVLHFEKIIQLFKVYSYKVQNHRLAAVRNFFVAFISVAVINELFEVKFRKQIGHTNIYTLNMSLFITKKELRTMATI
jgi:hypothetical protein